MPDYNELRIIKTMIQNLDGMEDMEDAALDMFILKWGLYNLATQNILENIVQAPTRETRKLVIEQAIESLHEAAAKVNNGGFSTPTGQA